MVVVARDENIAAHEIDLLHRSSSINTKAAEMMVLPSPPSMEMKENDSISTERKINFDSSVKEFFSWSRDQQESGVRSSSEGSNRPRTIQYIEWKKASTKRRKKKNIMTTDASSDDTSYQLTTATTDDGTLYSPAFSESRYRKQQKFKSLNTFYSERLRTETRQDENLEDLVVVKMELSEFKEWAKNRDTSPSNKPKMRVHFTEPLITATNYRPKTEPEEIDDLFFRDDDLLDWEEDRETTSLERFEVTIFGDKDHVVVSQCLSVSESEI